MKTLVKLAKREKSIPILGCVRVQSGIAMTTDMDIAITEPVPGVPDGLYHAEGFDLHVPFTHNTVDDFPLLIPGNELLGKATLSIDDIEFISRFMSTETTRYYLNGVCFNGCDMVSTDGHRLGKITFDTSFPSHESSYIVPAKAIKFILLLAAEHKQKTIAVDFFDNRFIAHIGEAVLYTKLVDANFPDYARVIPDNAEALKVPFVVKEFSCHAKTIRSLQKIAKIGYCRIEIKDGIATTTFTDVPNFEFPVNCRLPSATRYNLDYLLSMIDGELHFTDPRSPMKIVNGNRLCILMPTRI